MTFEHGKTAVAVISPEDWDSLRELLLESRPYLELVERRVAGSPDPTRAPAGGLERAQSIFRTMRLLATTFGLPPVGNVAREMEVVVMALRNGESAEHMWEGVRYAVESVRSLLCFIEVRARTSELPATTRGGRSSKRRAPRGSATAASSRRRSRRAR